jgi:hypothetical protein
MLRLYLDGELDTSVTAGGELSVNSDPLILGWTLFEVAPWVGMIDDVRLFSDTLDREAVAILYSVNQASSHH